MALLVLLIPLFLSACSSTAYLVDAGVGQWKLFNRERPVQEVLASPYTPKATKDAILTVMNAKKFAVEGLGLKATKNYSSYVQLDAEFVSWAVSASDALKLEEKKWKFPIVGEIPYLGFFQKEKAEKFANKMAEANPKPDIWIRGVPAFSSLGWFSDPLYSSMIIGGERDIADVVIHESLHATIWVGDSVDFNEKLANFVGLEGSLRYLQQNHPEEVNKAKKLVAGAKYDDQYLGKAVRWYYRKGEARSIRYAAKKITNMTPGPIAARNNLPNDCSDATEYKIMVIDGGNKIPKVPPAAMIPAAKPGE